MGSSAARCHQRSPLGPYQDVGPLLDPSDCPFAIDPHPFRDEDGQWYLFARDFLDSEAGVRWHCADGRPAQSMTKLAGKGKSLRARSLAVSSEPLYVRWNL